MRYHCLTCDGQGVIATATDGPCSHCKGSGKDPHPARAGQPCAICNGSKRIAKSAECPDCGGQGYSE